MATAEPRARGALLLRVFVVLYLLDAGLTAADELLALAGLGHALAGYRGAVAGPALLASLLVYAWMSVSAAPPKRVLIPPLLVLFWLSLGALPLPVTAPSWHGLAAALAQGLGAVYLVLGLWLATGGRPFAVERALLLPAFRPWRSLAFVGLHAVLAPVTIAGLFLYTFKSYIEQQSQGFVSFDWTGVNLADREYVRSGRSIRLVGMMHIGERPSYETLFRSFAAEGTVVLTEGVTDNEGRLARFGYGRVATSLGLDVQPEVGDLLDPGQDLAAGAGEAAAVAATEGAGDAWPRIEHADIDVSELTPETVAMLDRIGRLWNLTGPREQLVELLALSRERQAERWLELFRSDLLEKRNRHLLGKIDGALGEYRTVVVPWGGLHLPGIERQVLDRGFRPGSATERRLLNYSTVLSALLAAR